MKLATDVYLTTTTGMSASCTTRLLVEPNDNPAVRVSQGHANKEIALRLDISPRTVENCRAWVMEKMGARNLADLVRKALLLESGRP